MLSNDHTTHTYNLEIIAAEIDREGRENQGGVLKPRMLCFHQISPHKHTQTPLTTATCTRRTTCNLFLIVFSHYLASIGFLDGPRSRHYSLLSPGFCPQFLTRSGCRTLETLLSGSFSRFRRQFYRLLHLQTVIVGIR